MNVSHQIVINSSKAALRTFFTPPVPSWIKTLGAEPEHISIRNTSDKLEAMALNIAQIRDTKWLTLEVCREFQRGTCSRSDQECKFAHPAKSCQVDNGRVIACFDSLKVRTVGCVCVCVGGRGVQGGGQEV